MSSWCPFTRAHFRVYSIKLKLNNKTKEFKANSFKINQCKTDIFWELFLRLHLFKTIKDISLRLFLRQNLLKTIFGDQLFLKQFFGQDFCRQFSKQKFSSKFFIIYLVYSRCSSSSTVVRTNKGQLFSSKNTNCPLLVPTVSY